MAGEITFTPSEQDYADANRDSFLAQLRRPRPWVRSAAIVLLLAAVGAALAYIDGDTDAMGTTAAGFALLGLSGILLICLSVYLRLPRRTRRLYRQHKLLHKPWTYGWSEAGLSVETANGRAIYPWPDFHRRLVGRRTVLLFLNEQAFFFLPRRLLDESAVEELRSLAAAAAVPRI